MVSACLSGQVAVVTGASSPGGIGRAIALRFAAEGASVLMVAEGTKAQLDEVKSLCASEPNAGRIESALVDLGTNDGPVEVIALAEKLFGRVDILVNNAAVREPMAFGSYTRAQFDHAVSVNLAAPFFTSQAVLPLMRRQGGGRIIHIASQLGHVTYDNRALYGLTKAALIHLTKSMARELAKDGILVNAISPGPISTPAVADRPAAELEARFGPYLPGGRLGRPEEIAEMALFLASAAPAFLQGQSVLVDGGYTNH